MSDQRFATGEFASSWRTKNNDDAWSVLRIHSLLKNEIQIEMTKTEGNASSAGIVQSMQFSFPVAICVPVYVAVWN